MTEAVPAPQPAPGRQSANAGPQRVTELRVSGNLMTLETGLYCIVNKPSAIADARTGLPGVRLSLPPGVDSKPSSVEISTFRTDGWLTGFGDAALVRVHNGPAHVMVTIYQAPDHPEGAPNIQVVKLLEKSASPGAQQSAPFAMPAPSQPQVTAPQVTAPQGAAPQAVAPRVMDMVAHIQGLGDVGALIGDRLGDVGSKRWIEGFAIAPTHDVAPGDIEYQAVLGRGWLSPWVEGGEFCGSRGMALPVLGLRIRLRGDAERDFECIYSASFTDGSQAGPVPAGASCEAESLAPLESFEVVIQRRGQAAEAAQPAAAAPAKLAAPAKPAAARPAAAKPAKPAAARPAAAKPASRPSPGPRRR